MHIAPSLVHWFTMIAHTSVLFLSASPTWLVVHSSASSGTVGGGRPNLHTSLHVFVALSTAVRVIRPCLATMMTTYVFACSSSSSAMSAHRCVIVMSYRAPFIRHARIDAWSTVKSRMPSVSCGRCPLRARLRLGPAVRFYHQDPWLHPLTT